MAPVKLGLARAVGALSRRTGRGGGTSLPGKVLLRLQPDAIARLRSRLTGGTVLLSATNGKTTSAAILASILHEAGVPVVHNNAGANMPGGVATALLEEHDEEFDGTLGLFEVDEAWVANLAGALAPRAVVLGNLFRDQLDRYGELEKLADVWQATIAALPAETRVVLNADDPLIAELGRERDDVLYFGIEDDTNAEPTMRHAADSKDCRRCGHALVYDAVQLGHLGKWRCPGCGAARPRPAVAATAVQLAGMGSTSLSLGTPRGEIATTLPLPGLYNVYNALAAAAAALALDIEPKHVAAGIASVRSAFGRVETIAVDGLDVPLLLIKNPTGANEVLRTITAGDARFDLWLALNDKIADGRDVSWVWDADFERLDGFSGHVTCTGTRADELALRLAYAGIPRRQITVAPSIFESFAAAAGAARERGVGLRALPTYTALLELRTQLARHGFADDYWNRRT